MPRHRTPRATRRRRAGVVVLALALLCGGTTVAAADGGVPAAGDSIAVVDLASLGWVWPADGFRLARPYVAPAHEYGPGHRGIDLDLLGGREVRAPADGVIAFAGAVAGRGVLTIDHGDGLVTTLEPVETVLTAGTWVRRGDELAVLGSGGHAVAGSLHFGVRLDGAYINPQLLFGDAPRAILLPCCD